MTRHGEEFNEFHTCYQSIATYDKVQDSLALAFSCIIFTWKPVSSIHMEMTFFLFFCFPLGDHSHASKLQLSMQIHDILSMQSHEHINTSA